MLSDRYGRVATSLRVSVTDRCNLRCSYCMPEEGLDWLPKPELLTDDELVRVVGVAVGLGVNDVRLTGGEPLLRRGLVDVVARLAALEPRPTLSVTTNGIGLARLAAPLAAAGLDRVNVSLDTLDRVRYLQLTRRDRLADVFAGLAAAHEAGLRPVKVNAVLMRGVNDDEAVPLLQWALGEGYELRFIEQMPLDAQHGWRRDEMVTGAEILRDLRGAFELVDADVARGSAPAERWDVRRSGDAVGTSDTLGASDTLGRVGVIASVTRPFCGACDRIRLTADGQIRNCLFSAGEVDLRGALRSGADDAALADLLRRAVVSKLPGHGIDEPDFLQPARPMSAIGG